MIYPLNFIWASDEMTTLDNHIPAPLFRKTFISDIETTAHIIITACGFYELYVNGKNYTKGALAPYVSNPEHYIYYDEYDIPINKGKNAVGIILGNGFQNNPGGYIWDFDKASFRSAPKFALSITWKTAEGKSVTVESDESFLTAHSPIIFDDYRFGEHYDARLEKNGWAEPDFDDSYWKTAQKAPINSGEPKLCEAEPIVVTKELKPVSITKEDDGFRYDFGENCAGVCRLSVNGTEGQQIEMIHVERLEDNKISYEGLWFFRNEEQWNHDIPLIHKDIYICKGEENETYTPRFTYHGFRYVLVKGITEEQATADLLTYIVMNSDIKERGGFSCSDKTANTLQEMTKRSDLSNFYYFPTDCPQREKNGWTADAALSAEQMLLNFTVETSYREWLRNICKAQDKNGMIPGIVPTCTWGYGRGFGPSWDCVLAWLPYYVYVYRGTTDMIYESRKSLIRYLDFLESDINEDGLLCRGLGDWCHVSRGTNGYLSPLEFTSSISGMDIAEKAQFLFNAVGMKAEAEKAEALAMKLRKALRKKHINTATMTASGNCQTSQALAIYYNLFTAEERQNAVKKLIELINEKDGHMDIGVLGARVLFHVLADEGYADLAFNMIVRDDYPSYGNWIKEGATTLWEQFEEDIGRVSSMNHHFWGDISSWFIQHIAGIRLNPDRHNADEVNIEPTFISALSFADAYHIAPAGKISTHWERNGDKITLTVEAPDCMQGIIKLPENYIFNDKNSEKELKTGSYIIRYIK